MDCWLVTFASQWQNRLTKNECVFTHSNGHIVDLNGQDFSFLLELEYSKKLNNTIL